MLARGELLGALALLTFFVCVVFVITRHAGAIRRLLFVFAHIHNGITLFDDDGERYRIIILGHA